MLRSKFLLLAVLCAFGMSFAVPIALTAGAANEIAFTFENEAVTTLTTTVGARNVDIYYTVGGSSAHDSALTVTSSDENVVTARANSQRNYFRLTLVARGSATLTATSGDNTGVLSVTVDYEKPDTVSLTYPGAKPTEVIPVGDALTIPYSGDGFAITQRAVRQNGTVGSYDTENLGYLWEFADNTCGAAFADGELTVESAGSANVSVWATVSGKKVGSAKTFTLTSAYQRVGSDLNIVVNNLAVTGIVYTVGSNDAVLRYEVTAEGSDESSIAETTVSISDLELNFEVSNKSYIDPDGLVWESTDSSIVKVENGAISVNFEGLTKGGYYTLTLHDTINTVADNLMIVVNVPGDNGGNGNGGCGSGVNGVFTFGGLALTAVAVGFVCLKRARKD